MLVAPDKVIACVLVDVPRVKPLSILPKVRRAVSKVLEKLAPLDVILPVPEETNDNPVVVAVASMRSATTLMLLLLAFTCPAF